MDLFWSLVFAVGLNSMGIHTQPNPLMSMGGGLSESLSSVLDCVADGKTGLCVPTALKDIVCIPLGFKAALDVKVCGNDNVCCHSSVEKNATAAAATSPTIAPATVQVSVNVPASGSAIKLLIAKPDAETTEKPVAFKIPASLSAYIPGYQSPAAAGPTKFKSKLALPPIKATTPPVKLCKVGSSQGMCVKAELVGSLCTPMGFLTSVKGCSDGYQCCYTGKPDTDNDDQSAQSDPATTTAAPTFRQRQKTKDKDTPVLDTPSSMDTCSPRAGQDGLCIRADVAPAVCAPLGFTIGGRLTCAPDRVCCHSANPAIDGAITATNFAPPPTLNPVFTSTMMTARPCTVAPGVVGVCVPPSLLSSCPIFGRKVSAFGCPTKPLDAPEYCCFEDNNNSTLKMTPELSTTEPDLVQPYIAVAGSAQAPKLDATVCGRKGLTGIEPRALALALARHGRLLGSTPTLPGEYCWHAALFDENDKPYCNGVLVNRQWVLTAAHCVKRVGPAKTTVKLGTWSLSAQPSIPQPTPQTFRVLEAFIHYNYDGVTLDNNIALLHLSDAADFSEPQVCLACLPAQEHYDGATCTVTSWSTADGGPPEPDAVLSKLQLNVINFTQCDSQLRATGKLQASFKLNPDATMCAQAGTAEDTCKGDGGSALACPNTDGIYEVAGLVSWGLACGSGAPTIFTRVWLYNSWVQEIIRRYS